jgi:hypothetical protein
MQDLHRSLGRAHAALAWHLSATARDARGQGTVEYVALMLLVATILTAVVAASGKVGDDGIGKLVVGKLKDAIDGVGGARSKG